ncbi:hypothetical protein PXH69_24735 [Rhodococcus qingshengii]|uniref:Uncharacterized protein n=1 Tax=Rhodococcus qingshengii TaxID=334542 RepID=A0AAW6LQW9_RHOSG|nr:hypothetical protein [Rhodococcus qingshengii]MDE8648178.1 hypothetical protein [Rhodococcus qingshengii]
MSITVLSTKTVTARKPHQCMTCSTVAIKPGIQYVRSTMVYDGRIYDWVQCEPCRAITDLVWQWSNEQDGIDADHYAEWADEFQDHPKHGVAARAHLARLRPVSEVSS